VERPNGDVWVVAVTLLGQIAVVRDDGTAGTVLHAIDLPGDVRATTRVVADASGRALVGADDGQLYPVDLVAGTLGTPLLVDATADAEISDLVPEPPCAFATPSSVLVQNDQGLVARYCSTLGSVAAVPGLGAWGVTLLMGALAATAGLGLAWRNARTGGAAAR